MFSSTYTSNAATTLPALSLQGNTRVTIGDENRPIGLSSRRYAQASKSDATLRAYGAALRSFEAWCKGFDLVALPAEISTVADFLSAEADNGLSVSTIAQKAAAIRWAHKTAGLPSPTEAEAVQNVMRGIRRSVGVAPRQKAPATAECILTILAHVPATTLVGKRDRALLLLGFAGAFRRSEIASLMVEDLAFGENGVDVTIRKSKTDQEGRGQAVAIPHGVHLKPVEALQAWLAASGIKSGPVYRAVSRGDKMGREAITGHTVANVVKRYAGKAGLAVADFSGHSLRAGFVTSAADRGADLNRIMDVSRHVDPRTVRTYIRRADRYKDHAGSSFL
ncbi:site-specific integrase [Devosia sp. SD17-2]|uniref:site-specific integrase n=1 Tax=Devosia sp. SD17-2 TaxID=2976459 RepID=UPI0023D88966|nr:site-specific integrase [Devosia sp. SD17-2]WEJ31975.1 site-specific integrase [Devosia sp. SD17-2]